MDLLFKALIYEHLNLLINQNIASGELEKRIV